MDEAQAINLVLDNSFEGLAWLVERFQLKAIRTAYLITRDHQLAEDVVQEKFLKLPQALHRFEKTRKFEPWFLQSVVNAAISCVSRGKWEITAADLKSTETWLEGLPEPGEGVEQKTESADTANSLWDAMRQLPAEQRAVIVMRYYLDMPEREIAEKQGVPSGTIKWRLSAAKRKIKNWLNGAAAKEKEA